MNAPTSKCLRARTALGSIAVGDVADQHVLEGQLALAGQRRSRTPGRGCPSPAARRARARTGAGRCPPAAPASSPRTCGRPRRPAARAGARTARARRGARRARPARCPAARPPASVPSSAIRRAISSANSGLPPERSTSAGSTASPAGSSDATSDSVSRRAQRVEHQLGRRDAPAAPARAPVEQLVARQADDHQRRAHPLREVLDRVEHAVVGPVDVLEGEHERLPRRPSPRCRRAGRRRTTRAGAPGPRRAAPARPGPRGRSGGRSARSCARPRRPSTRPWRRTGRASTRAACPRPPRPSRCRRCRTPRAAPRPAPRTRSRCRRAGSGRCGTWASTGAAAELTLQLAQHARLADAGLADERDQVRRVLQLDALEDRLERRELLRRGRPAAPRGRGRRGRRRAGRVTATASQAGTGSDLPFSSSGSSCS